MNEQKKQIALVSTRPNSSISQLINELKDTNISVLNYPLTKIKPLKNYETFDFYLKNLNEFQHIIFISTNAVIFFLKRLKILSIVVPKNLIFSSIGPATKKLIQCHLSVNVHCPKKEFDSENLLKEDVFKNIAGEKILIIRGEGGRETLKQGLERRAAIVSYGECYIREYVHLDLNSLKENLMKYHYKFMLISSTNSAVQLLNQLKGFDIGWLQDIKIVVNHKSIKDQIKSISKNVLITQNIDSQSLKKLILSESIN